MTVNIRLVGWKINGCRCPDHEVDLLSDSGEPYKVSLIQMPNGTGKTTSLQLLRHALSGSASGLSPDEVRRYSKKGNERGRGGVEVRIKVGEKLVTFSLLFDFSEGSSSYRTTKGGGQAIGFAPPQEISGFLNPQFIDYFILDGELAERLLNTRQAEAQRVIDALFHVDFLKILATHIHDFWRDKTQGVTAQTTKGLSRRENDVRSLEVLVSQRKAEKLELDTAITKISGELRLKKEEFDTAIHANRKQNAELLKASDELSNAEKEEIQLSNSLLEESSKPQNLARVFATACLDLKRGLDRVKLPDAAAREFFEELCEEPECICGRPIDEGVANTIRVRSSRYLGSDDVSLLNSLKSSIDDAIGSDPEASSRTYKELCDQVATVVNEVGSLSGIVTELKLRAGEADPRVAQAQIEIDAKTRELVDLEKRIERYANIDELPDDQTFNIEILEKRLKRAEDALAEITNTLSIKHKTERLVSVLEMAYVNASEEISRDLVAQTNANISSWLPNNDIRLDKILGHLLLENKTSGSAGENLTVAYAFLATLFNRATHSLPFIVDSPAGALGIPVRREIGVTVPKLTGQFIAFVISSERQGFIEGGISSQKWSVQYLTVFRKSISKYLDAGKRQSHVETADGMVVESEEFFNSFELEEDLGRV